MPPVIPKRMTAEMDGEFVVFLIGMRINKLWKIHKWWPVAMAMPRMIMELYAHPELGFLGAHNWFGRTIIVLQYWKSFEALEDYARNKDRAHLPAWAAFNRAGGADGDVGIWHETYIVQPGQYENIYTNMPPFGLGAAGKTHEAVGRRERARSRMSSAPDQSTSGQT